MGCGWGDDNADWLLFDGKWKVLFTDECSNGVG